MRYLHDDNRRFCSRQKYFSVLHFLYPARNILKRYGWIQIIFPLKDFGNKIYIEMDCVIGLSTQKIHYLALKRKSINGRVGSMTIVFLSEQCSGHL